MNKDTVIQQIFIELLWTVLGTGDSAGNKTGSLFSQTDKITGFLLLYIKYLNIQLQNNISLEKSS